MCMACDAWWRGMWHVPMCVRARVHVRACMCHKLSQQQINIAPHITSHVKPSIFIFHFIDLLVFDFGDFSAWNADLCALHDRWWCFDGALRCAYHIGRYGFRCLMRLCHIHWLKFGRICRLFNALSRALLHLQFTFDGAMSQFFKAHLKCYAHFPNWNGMPTNRTREEKKKNRKE